MASASGTSAWSSGRILNTAVANRSTPQQRTSLNLNEASIRILVLHGYTRESDPIKCSLRVALLDDNPDYDSLSYVWGDPNETKTIEVDGQDVEITMNLHAFLVLLRRPGRDVRLWADAVCINQSDDEEKKHQIGLMGRVYRQCTGAHIYLGTIEKGWQQDLADKGYQPAAGMTKEDIFKSNDEYLTSLKVFLDRGGKMPAYAPNPNEMPETPEGYVELTLALIECAATLTHLYELPLFVVRTDSRGSRYVPNLEWPLMMDCMKWIMTRDWWGRVWTYQEAVLPRVNPQLHIGRQTIALDAYLEGMHTILGFRVIDKNGCCDLCTTLVDTARAGAQRFDESRMIEPITLRRQRKSFQTVNAEIPLQEAIWSSQGRLATDVRDHLFGILGLLPPWLRQTFLDPRYSSSGCNDLFRRCSWMLYEQERSLDGLRSAAALRKTKVANLPSWALDLSDNETSRLGFDRMWDEYKACGNVGWHGNISCQSQFSELTVKAIRVTSIAACSVWAPEEIQAGSSDHLHSYLRQVDRWRELHLSVVGPGAATASEGVFWRTILRDRDPMNETPALPTTLGMTAAKLNGMGRWWMRYKQTGNYLDSNDNANRAETTVHQVFRVNAACQAVRMYEFFCTAAGEPGIGPYEVQRGDEIFALAACHALAVLRRVEEPVGIQDRFRFVGLCYVDGWMNGEVTVRRSGGDWKSIVVC